MEAKVTIWMLRRKKELRKVNKMMDDIQMPTGSLEKSVVIKTGRYQSLLLEEARVVSTVYSRTDLKIFLCE